MFKWFRLKPGVSMVCQKIDVPLNNTIKMQKNSLLKMQEITLQLIDKIFVLLYFGWLLKYSKSYIVPIMIYYIDIIYYGLLN